MVLTVGEIVHVPIQYRREAERRGLEPVGYYRSILEHRKEAYLRDVERRLERGELRYETIETTKGKKELQLVLTEKAPEMIAERRFAKKFPTAPSVLIQTYMKAGYSKVEATKLASWSQEKQQTPSPEKAREILTGEQVKPFVPPPRYELPDYRVSPTIARRETYVPERQEVTVVSGKPKPFLSVLGRALEYPRRVVTEKVILGEKEYTQEELFTPRPTYEKIPRRETVTYAPPPLPVVARIEKERIITEVAEQESFRIEAERKAVEISNKYGKQLESKSYATQEELNVAAAKAERKAGEEFDKELNKLEKKYLKELTEREKQREKAFVKGELKEKFGRKILAGIAVGAFYGIPIYGKALFGKDIAEMARTPTAEITSYAHKYPKEYFIETGISLGTILLTGAGIARGKAKLKEFKVSQAIESAKIGFKEKGIVTEKTLGRLRISKGEKAEIKRLLEEGKQVRIYEPELKAQTGLEKYTPKLEGQILEVSNIRGEIITKRAVGELTAKLKGKEVTKQEIIQTLAKIEETGKVRGYSEIIELERLKKPSVDLITGRVREYKRPELKKFYEEAEIIKLEERRGRREIVAEATAKLISKEKYKGEPLMKEFGVSRKVTILPDFEALSKRGKLYSKTISAELQTFKKGEVKIFKEPVKVVTTKAEFEAKGIGIIQRIKPEVKIKKKVTSFFFGDEKVPEMKPPTRPPFKPVKIRKVAGEILGKVPEPEKMRLFGMVERMKAPERKAYPVPFGKTEATIGFLEGSAKELTGKRFIPLMKISPFMKEKEVQIQELPMIQRTKLQVVEKAKEKERLAVSPVVSLMQPLKLREEQRFEQKLFQSQLQAQGLKQQLQLERVSTQIPFAPPSFNLRPMRPPKVPFRIEFPEEREKRKEEEGYDALAYIQATKPKKSHWRKLNKQPLTKISALSMSARFVDDNISARGKVSKVELKTKKEKERAKIINTGDEYFLINRHKFRDYRIKKGKKFKLPNQFIEKSQYRLDKPSEILQITAAQNSVFRL